MAFWGVEIKPGKPYTHRYDSERGRLHVSQATLGHGSSTNKSIVQCHVGNKKPIFLCSLLPERYENCPLNIEFEEEEEVTFSIVGPHSVHLSGFFFGESHEESGMAYESDSDGEDIAETDTEDEESTEFDSEDEYDHEFIDDDLDMYPPSSVRKSGVTIEEILDDEKPANGTDISKQSKKKSQSNLSNENDDSRMQIVMKNQKDGPILEDEDEDGFPISSKGTSNGNAVNDEANLKLKDKKASIEIQENKGNDESASIKSLKRKIGAFVQDNDEIARIENDSEIVLKQKKKNKKKKKKKEKMKTVYAEEDKAEDADQLAAVPSDDIDKASRVEKDEADKLPLSESLNIEEKHPVGKDKKKNKKKDKKLDIAADGKMEQDEKFEDNAFQVRTFPNGLVIEELKMGRPDGKRASPGKKVNVRYIGKLKKNDKIFDSNIGRAPFKFRLGIGQVIKGWDIGINGMRVGDKRRLTIPPSMGYGAKGAGPAIPPNAWLIFDVELVDVN